MFDNARMLDFIERALADEPFCSTCGAPTTIEHDDGLLWLVCSSTLEPRTFAQRLSAAFMPHERHLVADLGETLAA
jgi:hypothetical protein